MSYEGGYTLLKEPLVRGGTHKHTSVDESELGPYAVEAVNLIQDTPWMVNPFVFDTVMAAKENGRNLLNEKGEVVVRLAAPLEPDRDNDPLLMRKPPEVWSAMSKEDRKDTLQRAAMVYQRFQEASGEYRSTQQIINTAETMSEHERFYFPHNMCFRGRIYPIPTDLSPQSNDLSKGLLRFHRPTPLGADGFFWLGVMAATHWGADDIDKKSPEERFEYASAPDFMKTLWSFVDFPMKNKGWLNADKPFQFLAAAQEWIAVNSLPDYMHSEFLSYLPGNLDGSCNGAQHLSIMARDLVGATATNCRANMPRQDLYMAVANEVLERATADAKTDNVIAKDWMPKLKEKGDRRKIVKRSVMTYFYGVTEYGIATFMVTDDHVEGLEDKWNSAKSMRDYILQSLDTTMDKGVELKEWFSRCAELVAEAGKPLVWYTPAGMKITQAYRNLIEKRIKCYDTRFAIYKEPEEDEDDEMFLERVGLQVKRMATAAAPNVVHSCDAAHLQITAVRMAEVGIRDFSMVHDSFGCPLAHVGLMRDILRQSIVDMYSGDYLANWKATVEEHSGITLPDPPTPGEFDITEILESEFFFA